MLFWQFLSRSVRNNKILFLDQTITFSRLTNLISVYLQFFSTALSTTSEKTTFILTKNRNFLAALRRINITIIFSHGIAGCLPQEGNYNWCWGHGKWCCRCCHSWQLPAERGRFQPQLCSMANSSSVATKCIRTVWMSSIYIIVGVCVALYAKNKSKA